MAPRSPRPPRHRGGHDTLSRILVVSYHFPPQAASASIRLSKFVKAWAAASVSVGVVCAPAHVVQHEDRSLADALPASVIRRTASDLGPWFLAGRIRRRFPTGPLWRPLHFALMAVQWLGDRVAPIDPQVGWLPAAAWRAIGMARRLRPEVVLVSGPPFSPFLVGAMVARLFRIPLVLDYRDPWMTSPIFRRVKGLRGRLNMWLEAGILRRATGVTAAHRFVLGELRSVLATETRRPRFFWVPNGYDPDDFGTHPAQIDGERFTISYAGALYGTRSPDGLLRALESLLADGTIDASRFTLRFMGSVDRVTGLLPPGSSLNGIVTTSGHLPHRESVQLLQSSTANLVIVGPRAGPTRWVPAKLYENLYARRPLILLSPEGVPTRLARRAGACRIAHPHDAEAIGKVVASLYDAWQRGEKLDAPDASRLTFFDRRHQADRLLRFMASLRPGAGIGVERR